MSERKFRTRGSIERSEDVDLEDCRRDPIHHSAKIQPHGTFLHFDPEEGTILSAAENVASFLETSPGDLLGTRLQDHFSAKSLDEITTFLNSDGPGAEHVVAESADRQFVGEVFSVGDEAGIELQTRRTNADSQDTLLRQATDFLDRLEHIESQQVLLSAAVSATRRLTGYERTMLYQFGKHGHGKVVAEDRDDDVTSYLGQRFPASDIPEPARRIYRENPVRHIRDARASPIRIHGPDGPRDRRELDLTYSTLRHVPEVHREYLANMGVESSLSISLLVDDEIWGLVVSHGSEATPVSWRRRHFCRLVGQVLSRRLSELRAARRESRYETVAEVEAEINGPLSSSDELFEEVDHHRDKILSTMDANLFCLHHSDRQFWLSEGKTPDEAVALLDRIQQALQSKRLFVVDSIRASIDEDWEASDKISGLMAIRLGASPRSFAVWFRPEHRQTIEWGGDPRQPAESDGERVNPRKSFEIWTQAVADRASPWREIDCKTAHRFRRLFNELTLEVQSHRLRELNEELTETNRAKQQLLERVDSMARTDELTDLANRREFQRVLKDEMERARETDKPVSLVLLDLDHFKEVNDTFGHPAGDRVLEQVGGHLAEATTAGELAARYGGEEFAVVLPETDLDAAERRGRELLETIRRDKYLRDSDPFTVTASAGVACSTTAGDGAEALMAEADEGLYRAKEAGRDRLATSDQTHERDGNGD